MTVSAPLALILLITIPIILYLGWPRKKYRRARDITSLVLRITIVLLLIAALADIQMAQSADKLAVVFAVDASDSVGAVALDNSVEYVREAMASMGENDQAGVVVFAEDAQVERAVTVRNDLAPIRSVVRTGNTDIAEAIRLSLALFPVDAARRIVIVSDGIPTVGDSAAAAQLAAASGVEISYVTVAREPSPEVSVVAFDAPSVVPQGQRFDLSITIDADQATNARIDVYASGELITSQSTTLRQGTNNQTLTLEGVETGFQDFSVVVEPETGDGYYQNNSLSAFSQVVGPARVLLVGQDDNDTRFLQDALQEADLIVDSISPSELPFSAVPLAQYDSVIIVNVPASILSQQRMESLQIYVRDLGGGLVFVGGPESYGPGGYFDTPMEATLPVEMRLKDQQRVPQLTLAYVIDRSGSMASLSSSGIPNIELAKAAINRSIDFLQPTDRAAIATFDAVAYWVAEFQDVLDKQRLQDLVGTLRPSGGTDILSGMQLVAESITEEPSDIKHIILLTDGLTNAGRLVETTRELYDVHNVTTTTISIGQNSQLLRDMAQVGGGNYHVADDVASIPSLFAQETVLATRSYIFEEESFVPSLTSTNPIMQGVNELPQLRGYVGTTEKPATQVLLRAPEPYEDPVLVAWQYGLGRSVAFTSDATARWAVDWVTWDGFSQFWNQVVRWTITEGGSENIETRVVMEDETARLLVDARDDEGTFLNGLDLTASIVTPDFENERVELTQVAPGRYEATFNPDTEGAYLLRVNGSLPDNPDVSVNRTTGWVRSYSTEYLTASTAESILPELAEVTNGQAMDEDVSLVFAHNLESRSASAPIWHWLVLIAMLLLPIDIAVRRLVITRSDWARLRAYLFAREESETQPTQRLSSLFDAREKAREKTRGDEKKQGGSTVAALKSTKQRTTESRPSAQAPQPAQKRDSKPREKPVTPSPSKRDDNIGAQLLKRKRDREKSDE